MDSPQSTLEHVWNDAPPGCTFTAERVERYDPSSGLFYAPTEYRYKEIEFCTDQFPDQNWIQDAFIGFVRGEFGSPSSRGECPSRYEWRKKEIISPSVLLGYRDRCEGELLYTGLIDEIIKSSNPGMSNQLYALFTDHSLGNKENTKNLNIDEFRSNVDPLIQRQDRLRLIIPSFPFKDQNVFRTDAPPSHVDLGEIAMLVRLHVLALAMFQVHPFGADWIIVSDGLAYAPIFQVDTHEVMLYRERLFEYRNQLNIQGTVNFFDLLEMTQRLQSPHFGFEIFGRTKSLIRHTLEKMNKSETGQVYESFRVLVRGMKWNMNNKTFKEKIGWENLWIVLNTDLLGDLPSQLQEAWQEIDSLAINAAFEYAAFNLALRYHSVLDRVLPNSLRSTIHPKTGQIAIPKQGEVFPWNGVGVLRDEKLGPMGVETWPLYKIIRQYPDAIPYFLQGQESPLYYLCQ